MNNQRFMEVPFRKVLALIPARGGSKSIPRKNIRKLAGHPLIAYSIAAGLAATTVTRVIVSTDDEEIAAVSRTYGAEVPFIRPAEYAQDQTPDLPVFQHAINWLDQHENYHPEIIVQLRPTSPFRNVSYIDQAVNQLINQPEADSSRTVIIPFQNPFKMWTIGKDGRLQPLIPDLESIGIGSSLPRIPERNNDVELYNMPRQALPDVYWQTGYVDAIRTRTIFKKNSMTGDHILPVLMDSSDWIDIDTPDDWRRAERLVESGELKIKSLGFNLD
jgi:N-acylneuraminate cytidylyltransferase